MGLGLHLRFLTTVECELQKFRRSGFCDPYSPDLGSHVQDKAVSW